MLNYFCIHIYAQKSMFIDKNRKLHAFFDNTFSSTLFCEFRVHRAGSQLKIKSFVKKLLVEHSQTNSERGGEEEFGSQQNFACCRHKIM